jgi:mersacidin/lichenicidin family type 2 lantibiotic
MTNEMIVRAWKDPSFRATLAPGSVPPSPVGDASADLKQVVADNFNSTPFCTVANCTVECTHPYVCIDGSAEASLR